MRQRQLNKRGWCIGIILLGAMLYSGMGNQLQAASPDLDAAVRVLRSFSSLSLQLAIEDLTVTFGDRYPDGARYLKQLTELEQRRQSLLAQLEHSGADRDVLETADALVRLKREALLANPLLNFEDMLIIKRRLRDSRQAPHRTLPGGAAFTMPFDYADGGAIGMPVNHTSLWSVDQKGYDNEVAVLSGYKSGSRLRTLYKPEDGRWVGEMDLHFDADRFLLTMPENDRWHVFEMRTDGAGLRRVTPVDQSDIDFYDACYLPGGDIIVCSNASYQSVPCWNGLQIVASLYRMRPDGTHIRQLTFDQDDDNYPTVMNSGQVLFTRWEYANIPHFFGRLLFQMNPDGTAQRAYYGSNSYWPNAVYCTKAIPGHPTKVAGIVSGHHGYSRMGELVIFDPAKSRSHTDGVVQRIPGRGTTLEPKILDNLVDESWPKFLHPHPLNEHYFLVSAKPAPESTWGIYLVDTFDNMLLLYEEAGYAALEPAPLAPRPCPPVIPDRIQPNSTTGVVYMQNVYVGPGLAGIPQGAVKALRVHAYSFGYRGVSGHDKIGIDGPWDVMRIIGTVPVESDGSAYFHVPANTPIAVQPLDAKGRALQVMRSWFTVMPGEVKSCVGCHEEQNTVPPSMQTHAAASAPREITSWYGPPRGFDFAREVQPVLDRYCVGCHDGSPAPDGMRKPDLRPAHLVPEYKGIITNVPKWYADGQCPDTWKPELQHMGNRVHMPIKFTPAYEALHPYARRPGLEGDYFLSVPAEYHANTSPLIQMLEKGHHNVQLDREAWDRLATWIDLNVPCHGTWGQIMKIPFDGARRKRELLKLYANLDVDTEAVMECNTAPVTPVMPDPECLPDASVTAPGWPFDRQEAAERQRAAGFPAVQTVQVDDTRMLELVLIPAGELLLGDVNGAVDERPRAQVTIAQPFWMATTEITNSLYRQFDPAHDSRYVNQHNMNVSVRGYPLNAPDQPVVRVSWERAMAFCAWLSEWTGKRFTLPTEAQWEWACRAGAETPMSYGSLSEPFYNRENLADVTLAAFARTDESRLQEINPAWMLRVNTVNDGALVTTGVGRYWANVWGLHDMHGNAAEWTRTAYRAYPYDPEDGRDDPSAAGDKVVRGGSWYDTPNRARAGYRLHYPAWQRVHNVGFRVVCEEKK